MKNTDHHKAFMQNESLGDSELENLLRLTSLHFENQNENSPAVFDNLPEAFKKRVMYAIIAFEIEGTEMDTVFKLSQGRDEESYHSIIRSSRGKMKMVE
ncbi:MAG TPA: hypothetical protein VJ949_14820 [Cryomorphaceae bacterium]|nr:hypothetical protein [Cryomorphaceae bacterium]